MPLWPWEGPKTQEASVAREKQSESKAWSYKAEIITPCNCDWGCPCTFNQPPTYGFCEGGWLLKIQEGAAGGTDLSQLGFAVMGSWPKALHFGGGTGKLIIDDKSSPAQRAALEGIAQGKLGGQPWPILSRTIDRWLPTSFTPFEWKFDGANSSVVAGDQLRAVLEPMRNPVTGKEVHAKIVLPDGILTRELNVTSTQTFSLFAEGLKYAWPGRNAWFSTVEHGT
jgi:hypothetical protein